MTKKIKTPQGEDAAAVAEGAPATPVPDDGCLYVSSVEGQLVSRFGTRSLIGCRVLPPSQEGPGGPQWETERVEQITAPEFTFYRREYLRLVKQGGLVRRTVEDWRRSNEPAKPEGVTTDG
jgi:hypothetical protein